VVRSASEIGSDFEHAELLQIGARARSRALCDSAIGACRALTVRRD
jgi:hypothetical protein